MSKAGAAAGCAKFGHDCKIFPLQFEAPSTKTQQGPPEVHGAFSWQPLVDYRLAGKPGYRQAACSLAGAILIGVVIQVSCRFTTRRLNRRKFMASATGIAAGAVVCVSDRSLRADTRQITPRVLYRNFQGWGTSLAWWAHIVGAFPAHIRKQYLNNIFDVDHGLGLTVARYNIGGGENPKYHFLTRRAAIPGYAPHPPYFNWAADRNQRLILHECMAMGVNQVQAFSNSPPWYMTISGSVTGGKKGADNLQPKCFQSFADYLAIVVAHFSRVWNVRFQTVEPFNEPVSYWWKFGGRQEGCRIGNREQNIIIPLLHQSLRNHGLATEIAAPDDNAVNQTIQSFQSYGKSVRREVAQIDTHSYHGHGRQELRRLASAAGKRLWMSEYGDGDETGMTMARRIIKDIRELQPQAWVYWQVVDGPGWGMMVNDENGRDMAFRVTEKYHVMAQFSRYIRPGDWIMDTTGECMASYRHHKKILTIVAVNSGDSMARLSFNLQGFRVYPHAVQTCMTDRRHRLARGAEQRWRNRQFDTTIPPEAVKTWIFNDCHLED